MKTAMRTYVEVSHNCRFAFEPATARVVGSSGQKEAENTFPYSTSKTIESAQLERVQQAKVRRTTPRSLAVTREIFRFPA